MKTQIKYLTMILSLLIFSCKKEEATPVEMCKLSTIDRGNGNKHAYTYDANGRVATMTRKFGGSSGTDPIVEYVYKFTYDNAGLLIKSDWTIDGKPEDSETYSYLNGKIAKAKFGGGENNLKYDELGRISSVSLEVGDPNYDFIFYLVYDENGIIVKNTFKTLDGTVFYETITKPVGVVKSPEQLLSKYGLPYDVFVLSLWTANQGGVGTTYETYEQGINGRLFLSGTTKVTDIKTDDKGYASEITTLDVDSNLSRTQRFTLVNCN
jgi:YD repeat-containing protein